MVFLIKSWVFTKFHVFPRMFATFVKLPHEIMIFMSYFPKQGYSNSISNGISYKIMSFYKTFMCFQECVQHSWNYHMKSWFLWAIFLNKGYSNSNSNGIYYKIMSFYKTFMCFQECLQHSWNYHMKSWFLAIFS